MKIFSGTIEAVNSFLYENKNMDVTSIEVIIPKSTPYYSLYLKELENPRDYELQLNTTRRTAEMFDTDDILAHEGKALIVRPYTIGGDFKYVSLIRVKEQVEAVVDEATSEEPTKNLKKETIKKAVESTDMKKVEKSVFSAENTASNTVGKSVVPDPDTVTTENIGEDVVVTVDKTKKKRGRPAKKDN